MIKKSIFVATTVCGLALGFALPSAAADLQSPELVKTSLRILAYVQDDMSRKLSSKSYERLPHENQEFQEAAVPMREAIANEPTAFKAKVEVELKKALAAANKVEEVSKTKDEAKVKAAIAVVAETLKPLNALFPANLRPVAGQLGAGPGGPRGPAPANGAPPAK